VTYPLHELHDIAPPFDTLPIDWLQTTRLPDSSVLEIIVATKSLGVMAFVAKNRAPPWAAHLLEPVLLQLTLLFENTEAWTMSDGVVASSNDNPLFRAT